MFGHVKIIEVIEAIEYRNTDAVEEKVVSNYSVLLGHVVYFYVSVC